MREFTIILDPDTKDGGYTVTVPALPGCITEGDTREEAIANAKEAIELYIESLLADGEPIPNDLPDVEVLKVAV
jgi:antitoxin HicB